MFKKALHNSKKYEKAISKDALFAISNKIDEIFSSIEQYDDDKLVNRELSWFAEEIEKNWNLLNYIHVIKIMQNVSNLKTDYLILARDIIRLTLDKCTKLLEQASSRVSFSNGEIAQLFNIIPKLPITSKEYKALVLLLISNALDLMKWHPFATYDSAIILDALAKLEIDLLSQRVLIKKLLNSFQRTKESFLREELNTLHSLWQFCVYAKSIIQSDVLNELFVLVNNEIKARREVSTDVLPMSKFQKTVSNFFLSILSPSCKEKVKIEYAIGSYSLDIALPDEKLNIEIDGPMHYWGHKIKRTHSFRDYLLNAYEGWKVIRIPQFEWEQLANDHQVKLEYLLLKFSEHETLLKMIQQNNSPSSTSDPDQQDHISPVGILK